MIFRQLDHLGLIKLIVSKETLFRLVYANGICWNSLAFFHLFLCQNSKSFGFLDFAELFSINEKLYKTTNLKKVIFFLLYKQ